MPKHQAVKLVGMVGHLSVSQLRARHAERPDADFARFTEVDLDEAGLGVAPMPVSMRSRP